MKLSERVASAFERGSDKRALIAMVLLLATCDDGRAGDTVQPSTTPSHSKEIPAHIVSVTPAVSKRTSVKQSVIDAGSDANADAGAKKELPKWARLISQEKVLPNAWGHNPSTSKRKDLSKKCPPDMVNVDDKFCIDRYESSIFSDGRRVSPFYHPSQYHSRILFNLWQTKFAEFSTPEGLKMPIPQPDAWQLSAPFEVEAVSKAGVLPNGYTNLRVAKESCENVGKKICSQVQWEKACRGEEGTKFPYGDKYRNGLCNVFRYTHPVQALHTNGSSAMNDPRLNLVKDSQGNPLLEKTGTRSTCASKWGDDAAYDMVGNLDEWVDDAGGRFVGGFYARDTREGCYAGISGHPAAYFDYTTGVRCCRNRITVIVRYPDED